MGVMGWGFFVLAAIVVIVLLRRGMLAYQERNQRAEAIARMRHTDPALGDLQQEEDELDLLDDYDDQVAPAPLSDDLFTEQDMPATAQEEKLIVLYVVAQSGQFFTGKDIQQAMQQTGLCYGDMNIYHAYPHGTSAGNSLFSVANVVEPGTFDIDTMDKFSTPGLSLFLQMPCLMDELKVFDQMVVAARKLAECLHGEVLDDHRSAFLQQTHDHLRDEVVAYRLRLM
ncbi:MAG: cell division protein ZipA [Gammaproteobacteria bacterium]|nr:cell division protein ZipA [Gammaproteobacteria bacterium]